MPEIYSLRYLLPDVNTVSPIKCMNQGHFVQGRNFSTASQT